MTLVEWAVVFLVIAIVAGLFGFFGLASFAWWLTRVCGLVIVLWVLFRVLFKRRL